MNPSPSAVAAIRAKVTDWTPSDATIAASLNAPSVANPTPQPTVAKPYTVAQVFGLVSAASVANLKSVAYVPDIRDKIQANDTPGCVLYANLLLGGSVITQAEHDTIVAAVTATQPDPSWPAQISWAQANLGRPVDAQDIAASRPGA